MSVIIGTDIQEASRLLLSGALVGIPTETVYGLAAMAFNEAAVLGIFEAKQRPRFDPLIVHIGQRSEVTRVVRELPPGAEQLMEAFWPGPLTLVLPKHPDIPELVTSGLDTVGVRMPAHPMTLKLLNTLGCPLAAPSANPFGYISPTTAHHVAEQLGDVVSYVLDGGPCSVGVESTIIGWVPSERSSKATWTLYRPGGIPVDEIESVLGKTVQTTRTVLPVAPGMLESHYAPRKPTYVGEIAELLRRFDPNTVGVLSFRTTYDVGQCKVLSADGDLSEAARHLFRALRDLDRSDCEVIVAEVFPDEGLGLAINDRLRRASGSK